MSNASRRGSTAMPITEPLATPLLEGPTYVLSRWLFLRLLGVVYLIAFVSLAGQVTGLVGEHGLLPAQSYLERVHQLYGAGAYRLFPTLCWLGAGDGALRFLCWGGAALAVLLVAGVAQLPVLALLWAFYLSLSVVGQAFLWFQWDALLLETGLVAVLYAPTQWLPSLVRERAPSPAMRWLVWALLFKLIFLSGITKLASGDPKWRNLTALDYHFWTQPLPPWPAWYAQRLPAWVHQGMTLATFAIELGAPWLILTPPASHGRPENPLLAAVAPFRSINGYGLFRVMTTERPEIVIEGTRDGAQWTAYEFRWKPGSLTRRPRFVQPHQPRLDWQMWFAALDPEGAQDWLVSLLRHLLEGTPQVLALLDGN